MRYFHNDLPLKEDLARHSAKEEEILAYMEANRGPENATWYAAFEKHLISLRESKARLTNKIGRKD